MAEVLPSIVLCCVVSNCIANCFPLFSPYARCIVVNASYVVQLRFVFDYKFFVFTFYLKLFFFLFSLLIIYHAWVARFVTILNTHHMTISLVLLITTPRAWLGSLTPSFTGSYLLFPPPANNITYVSPCAVHCSSDAYMDFG